MAKTKRVAKKVSKTIEMDSIYLLKMVLYLILGAQWLWLTQPDGSRLPLPVGLLLGILFALHDHFQIDRKIEYAVLLLAMLVGFIAQIGIFIAI